jgi:cytosine/uracil/thiamine/allantoin permease
MSGSNDPNKKVYRVNPMNVSDFTRYLRDHGWPTTSETTKALIEAGIFAPAAIAYPKRRKDLHGNTVTVTDFVIIPKRIDAWFRENADEIRLNP